MHGEACCRLVGLTDGTHVSDTQCVIFQSIRTFTNIIAQKEILPAAGRAANMSAIRARSNCHMDRPMFVVVIIIIISIIIMAYY